MSGSGFKFNNLHTNNFFINVVTDNRGILPAVTRITQTIPLVPGTTDFKKDTYGELPLRVVCYLNYHGDKISLRRMIRDIRGWLYNDGEYYDLIFDDEPDRKYKAKIVSAVDLAENKKIATFTIEFTCNPPYQFLLNNDPVTFQDEHDRLYWDTASRDGNQYIQELTAPGYIRFTVGGSMAVKPIIKLLNNIPAGLNLKYGTAEWQYNGTVLYDGIVIDCVNETVKRSSDQANLFPFVDEEKDAYFVLQPGQSQIDITPVQETDLGVWPKNLIIIVEFEPIGG